MLLADHY